MALTWDPQSYPRNPAWMLSEAAFNGAFGSRCASGSHFCPCPDGYFMTGSILGRYPDGRVGGDGTVMCYPHKPGSQGPAGSCSGRQKFQATLAPFDIVVQGGKIVSIVQKAPISGELCFDQPPMPAPAPSAPTPTKPATQPVVVAAPVPTAQPVKAPYVPVAIKPITVSVQPAGAKKPSVLPMVLLLGAGAAAAVWIVRRRKR